MRTSSRERQMERSARNVTEAPDYIQQERNNQPENQPTATPEEQSAISSTQEPYTPSTSMDTPSPHPSDMTRISESSSERFIPEPVIFGVTHHLSAPHIVHEPTEFEKRIIASEHIPLDPPPTPEEMHEAEMNPWVGHTTRETILRNRGQLPSGSQGASEQHDEATQTATQPQPPPVPPEQPEPSSSPPQDEPSQ